MTQNKLSNASISRRRLLGTTGAGVAAAVFGGFAMPTGFGRVVTAADGGKEFHSAWPYTDPGAGGHFNQFATDCIQQAPSIIGDMIFVPSALMFWSDYTWMPLVAESWEFSKTGYKGVESTGAASPAASAAASPAGDSATPAPAPEGRIRTAFPEDADTFTVHIRKGIKWSDDSELTAKDYVTTFMLRRLQSHTVWDYVGDMEAKDDYTVNFYMKKPTTLVERYVLRMNVFPDKTYGEWATKTADLIKGGKKSTDPDWLKLGEEFTKFRPTDIIVDGPFNYDMNSITNAQMTLVKNEKSYWAKNVGFDKIVNYNGETDQIAAVVLSKDVDYATHGFAPATEAEFGKNSIRVLRPPTYGGAALWFNFKALPEFADKKVRQALAHAINREQSGTVSLGKSGVGVKYMAGMADAHCEHFLTDEVKGKLNQYEYDQEKAAALLQEAGWKKDGDQWKTKDGKTAEYELVFPAEFADYSATGMDMAEQLTNFGIKTNAKPITYTQIATDVDDGKFQMAIQGWGSSANPHPLYSYQGAFFTHNHRDPNAKTGRGADFPLKQTVDALGGKEIDLDALTVSTGVGMSEKSQLQAIADSAVAFNELLNIIPMYERFGNNACLENVRVQPWPADDNEIYKNSPYADGIITILMLNGTLKPV